MAGSYKVTYNVSDSAGNAAAEVTRTVDVVEEDSSGTEETNSSGTTETTTTDTIAETITTDTTTKTLISDTTKPVITLKGDELVKVSVGTIYTDAGATASDDVDGVILLDS